ncbi:DsrE family protein [Thermus sp.]|uniref:DsrE family protein n=1 Tax=Thermus sp. TaxID=275 RepID=UPI00307DA3E6
MKEISRRWLLRVSALLGASSLLRAQANERVEYAQFKKETPVAVVYHADFGDPARFGQMLTNIANHLSVYDNDPFKIHIVVVAHGAGVHPFLKDLEGTPWASIQYDREALFSRIRQLAQLGVGFYICEITFARNNIPKDKLRPDDFIKWVPSGVGALGELQSKGYAYIKVG